MNIIIFYFLFFWARLSLAIRVGLDLVRPIQLLAQAINQPKKHAHVNWFTRTL
jgi:hypothetical protein